MCSTADERFQPSPVPTPFVYDILLFQRTASTWLPSAVLITAAHAATLGRFTRLTEKSIFKAASSPSSNQLQFEHNSKQQKKKKKIKKSSSKSFWTRLEKVAAVSLLKQCELANRQSSKNQLNKFYRTSSYESPPLSEASKACNSWQSSSLTELKFSRSRTSPQTKNLRNGSSSKQHQANWVSSDR